MYANLLFLIGSREKKFTIKAARSIKASEQTRPKARKFTPLKLRRRVCTPPYSRDSAPSELHVSPQSEGRPPFSSNLNGAEVALHSLKVATSTTTTRDSNYFRRGMPTVCTSEFFFLAFESRCLKCVTPSRLVKGFYSAIVKVNACPFFFLFDAAISVTC